MPAELTAEQRKILYRANHRGMKEADVLLGGFTTAKLASLSDAETAALVALLDELDADIMDWVMGRYPLPAHLDVAIFAQVMAFKPYA